MPHHDLRPRKRRVPWIVRTVGGRFAYLLVAMIALMLAVPLLSYGPMWGILITVSTSAVLVACLHATRPGRGAIRFGLCLAISDVGTLTK